MTVLFVIALALGALSTHSIIAAAFGADPTLGLVVLILSPIIYLLFVLYSLVLLEFVVVVFRIAENTSIMTGDSGTYS